MSAKAPHVTRRAGPVLGGPIVERRPSSCADMRDTPRTLERAGWTPLEAVGAAALTSGWLYMLWLVVEHLAS